MGSCSNVSDSASIFSVSSVYVSNVFLSSVSNCKHFSFLRVNLFCNFLTSNHRFSQLQLPHERQVRLQEIGYDPNLRQRSGRQRVFNDIEFGMVIRVDRTLDWQSAAQEQEAAWKFAAVEGEIFASKHGLRVDDMILSQRVDTDFFRKSRQRGIVDHHVDAIFIVHFERRAIRVTDRFHNRFNAFPD